MWLETDLALKIKVVAKLGDLERLAPKWYRLWLRGNEKWDVLKFEQLPSDSPLRTAAPFQGFANHEPAYCCLGGFDPKFACISPGTLPPTTGIEQAVQQGCTHFDFLRGSEPYKYLWGARDTTTYRRVERRTSNDER